MVYTKATVSVDPEISLVIPCFNEEASVRPLFLRLRRTMESIGRSWEVVFVDDGSSDATFSELEAFYREDPRVRVVKLRANFGQTPALQAGFDHVRGDVVIAMDGDLQHSPEDIPRFLERIDDGFDVVSGWRESRPESLFVRQIPSRIANGLMRLLSGVPLRDFGTTFKAYRRPVLRGLRLYGEFHRFIPVLLRERGASMCEVPIRCGPRAGGKSNYGIGRTFTVFFDLIRLTFLGRYLTRPLEFFGTLGIGLAALGGAIEAWLIYLKYVHGLGLLDYRAPLFLLGVLLVVVGTQFLTLGLLGEIVVRMYHSGGRRRVYDVDQLVGGRSDDVPTRRDADR